MSRDITEDMDKNLRKARECFARADYDGACGWYNSVILACFVELANADAHRRKQWWKLSEFVQWWHSWNIVKLQKAELQQDRIQKLKELTGAK